MALLPTDLISPCLPMRHGTGAKMWRNGKGLIVKDLRGGNLAKVGKEYDIQRRLMEFTNLVPAVYACIDYFIIMEDLGERHQITDFDRAFLGAQSLLEALEKADIRHNDLQPANVFIRHNLPLALDFGWAQWMHEEPYPNHPTDRKALISAIHRLKDDVEAKRPWSWTSLN